MAPADFDYNDDSLPNRRVIIFYYLFFRFVLITKSTLILRGRVIGWGGGSFFSPKLI